MAFIKFVSGDILLMKKKHPCGSDRFKVIRGGSDTRLVCEGCGRDLELPREKIEKSVKRVFSHNPEEEE